MTGSVQKELLLVLSFNVSISFHLLFLLFHFSSILVAKFFCSLYRKTTTQSTSDGSKVGSYEEDDYGFFNVECTEKEDLLANIIHGGEALFFLPRDEFLVVQEDIRPDKTIFEDPNEIYVTEQLSMCNSTKLESKVSMDDEMVEEKLLPLETDMVTMPIPFDPNENGLVVEEGVRPDRSTVFEDPYEISVTEQSPICSSIGLESNVSRDDIATTPTIDQNKNGLVIVEAHSKEDCENRESDKKNIELETKKLHAQEIFVEEIYGDSTTSGSTSKDSSEWRSSIIYRDSGSEDPFSSSSRRSCPNWESYTMFPKYDEEMAFFDRICAQKLTETESLRAIEVCPRPISQRIVHKFTKSNKRSIEICRNPYHELENAYLAQICLAWEALNWNYMNYQRLIASRSEEDPGCPGQIAQHFQRFQVLLQRYIENEPYEHGRRPEIFARIRISAPKLLQVPEFRDDHKEKGSSTRVSSAKFLEIIEDAIQTFMNFLKADREKHYQIFTAFFKRNHKCLVDPTFLHLMKKENSKKKRKLKDLRRTRKCLKKRKLKEEEKMVILMGLIDLKVVSRVLRMSEISEVQLHWCEDKMSKVRVWEGKLQRDSSPLFFPAH